MKPRVFIASSTENKVAALTIQSLLEEIAEFVESTVWSQKDHVSGQTLLENLIDSAEHFDWGIFLFTPDDTVEMRGKTMKVVRDNVLFELGLFTGRRGRDRTIIVMPRGMEEFRLPSDMAGWLTITYDPARPDLDAALGPAAVRIRQALSSGTRKPAPSAYLARYVERKEPSLLVPDLDTEVTYDRGYQILLDMFENESVEEFRAFDLAFERWGELLRDDAVQTQNTSKDIFDSTEQMLKQGRCKSFRRILVLNPQQLDGHGPLLRYIENREAAWRKAYPGVTVETRIFRYPGTHHDTRRIADLHDFALFKGEAGRLAIIEALEQPTDSKRSRLKVVTRAEKTTWMEREFDEFWHRSYPIRNVLDRLTAPGSERADAGPVSQALRHFLIEAQAGRQTAVVVEAAYLDLRTPEDEDRLNHLDEAIRLLQALQVASPAIADSIFLDAFINNYTSCRVERGEGRRAPGDDRAELRQALIDEELLPRIGRSYPFDPEHFRHFEMRAHSKDVRAAIREALRRGRPEIREQDDGDTTLDIYAVTGGSRILLGRRHAESWKIIPRCTALMAQHYFDLYRFVVEKKPDVKELWIFDFNRYVEADAVRMGADASVVLHPWPHDLRLRIVNCIYSPDGRSGSMHVSKWPR